MGEYVELRGNGYYLSGSRVSLDSVVYALREGASAESIQQDFPSLTLEQIHGAIKFYLGRKGEIDQYLAETERLWQQGRSWQASLPADLKERLGQAREKLHAKRS